ncbi:MAG TPA: glutathione peroxidase [Ferruginibacter sp.]|nr:glutathione peroxidase [Ferruginibacter sp.]
MKNQKKYRGLKIVFVVVSLLVLSFWGYVEIANRNSKNMTGRQKVLKAVYPLWIWWANKRGKGTKKLLAPQVIPAISFYSLKDTLIDGTEFDFEKLKGKKVLLVNTASDCGYTGQYDDLQKLSEKYKDKLVVIGFPANDFKEQEKGSNEEIAAFCKMNFGVSFPLMKKSSVKKGLWQNPVFQWLTDPAKNGWSSQQPSWNFCKYIVDENGRLTNYFASTVEPMGKEIINAINQ